MSRSGEMEAAAAILVADDDPTMLRIASRLLKKTSHQVIEAADREEALRLIRAEEPDLLCPPLPPRARRMGG